jgi:iron complex outermembrane receptor protein
MSHAKLSGVSPRTPFYGSVLIRAAMLAALCGVLSASAQEATSSQPIPAPAGEQQSAPTQAVPAQEPPASEVPAEQPAATPLPAVQVGAPRPRAPQSSAPSPRASVPSAPRPTPALPITPGRTQTAGLQGAQSQPPLAQVPSLDKTGTRIADLPVSVQVVPREVVAEQGGTSLRDAVRNVSGMNEGGPSSYGFFDRFLIRGLDARIYSDGFPDGDQVNGFPHSLNGVQRVEVLKGPGSALFGSGPPGGTINMVHYMPAALAGYGIGTQVGAFGATSTSGYATGPTTLPGTNYRVDVLAEHAEGFRRLKSADYEARPVLNWIGNDHNVIFALDARHIERTPDLYGIVYFNGAPASVPRETHYSTPFSHGNQDIGRATLTDVWSASDALTVNNRVEVTYRDLDILRNSGGSVTGTSLTGRQLRHQHDNDADLVYQFEPVWKFRTGLLGHTLLTGFQLEQQHILDERATADLANIASIFAPVIPETSTNGLAFLRDAKHSGMVDNLHADYVAAYAVDQIDVGEALKVRLSARQDVWSADLTPDVFVPGRIRPDNNLLFVPGVAQGRIDKPFSWSAGALYNIIPGISPFVGVARSYLTNFNSEATQNGIVQPESGLQYEEGIKFATPDGRVTITTALFKIIRSNVFTEVSNAIFFNAQETRGGEADLNIQLTPKWKILANLTIQHAVLTENPSQPLATGLQPIGVPAKIFNLWSSYDFALAGIDGFRIAGGMTYTDRTYGDVLNTNSIPPAAVADMVVSFNQPRWEMAFGVKNILDATYFTSALGAGALVGQPRTFYFKAATRL